MKFTFTDEQQQFRDYVRRFMTDKSPISEVRRLMETDAGYDPDVWQALCTELGLTGVHIPEAYGGQGFTFVELGIVMEEMGRSLFPGPYFASSVLAGCAILNAGNESDRERLLPDIASGKQIATLALAEPNGRWDTSGIGLTLTPDGHGLRLDGAKSFVLDGCVADYFVVVGREPGSTGDAGLSLVVVGADAPGVTRRPLASIDPTRKLARLEFNGARGESLGNSGQAASALARTLEQAAVALASEMVGGAQTMLDTATEYARARMQFGRPIGSFQAIKHRCADMLLDVELARSGARYAADAAAQDDSDLPALASLVKASAADAYMRAAASCIQIHGGIGFTWDHDTHLWFKRAKGSEVFLGSPNDHRERLMQQWGDSA